MSERKYQSPGPGLDIDDFEPARNHRQYSPVAHSAKNPNDERKSNRFNKNPNMQGGVVGHQHYGAWHEQNNFFQPPAGGHGPPDMHGAMPGMMHIGANHYSASQKQRVQPRPLSSSHKAKQRRGGSKMRNRNKDMMRHSQHLQHHQHMMQHPMMQSGFPMPMPMMTPFELGGSIGPMASQGLMPAAFNSISDTNLTAATTAHNQSHHEETERKNKARIELLEKKIAAKDQLFEDALASTIATSCACGSGGSSDNKSLTSELKKRFLALKTRYEEAEQEIERLTKTVKVVEVEVREDTEPFREEIQKLKDEKYDLQQINARLEDQIADQRLRIEQLERENSKRQLDEQRFTSEILIFEEKIRGLEEQLRVKTFDFDGAQTQIRELREANSSFEMQIQLLQSQLSDASLYQSWYEAKSKEYDDLQVLLSEEQQKVMEKEDEIMNLTDKYTVECETTSELRVTITELNERITELEEELAKKPDVKDDSSSSSSSSSEKEDLSDELKEWKSKYEKLDKKHEEFVSDFESHKRTCQSEIEELTTTNKNWEKRIAELKLLLRRNNISLDDSPKKADSNFVSQQIISSTHIVEKKEKIEKKEKKSKDKKKKKVSSSDSDSSSDSSSDSDSSDDKKKKKKKKEKKKKEKMEVSVMFDKTDKHEADDSPSHSLNRDPSLLMSITSTTNVQRQHSVSGLVDTNVQNPDEFYLSPIARETIEKRDEVIQQLGIKIEELQDAIEIHDKREEERKKEQGILGKVQATVNVALYKSKYEDAQKRLNEQQLQSSIQIRKIEDENHAKLKELVDTFQTNKEMIERIKKQQVEGGDPEIKIFMNDVKIEVIEKQIFLDRHVIEASDHAKFAVLDQERKLIKQQFQKLFKKRIMELEANVLAYQDLLMTKEMRVRQLEKELVDATCQNRTSLEAEIMELKIVLESKLKTIELMKLAKFESNCEADHDSDDDLTGGKCNKNKLKRRVYKKIEHLNEYIKNEVKPEIHAQYTKEIKELMRQHHDEIDKVSSDYESKLTKLRAQCDKDINLAKNQVKQLDKRHLLDQETINRNNTDIAELNLKNLKLTKDNQDLQNKLDSLKAHIQADLDILYEQHQVELRQSTANLKQRNTELGIQIATHVQTIKDLMQYKEKKVSRSNERRLEAENLSLKEELNRLKNEYAGIEATLDEKDQIIQEYIDYKRQWNASKFSHLQLLISQHDEEMAKVKAHQKQKRIDLEVRIKAELNHKLLDVQYRLEIAEASLAESEGRCSELTLRVEELEMMASNNSLEVKEVQRRYKVMISQLKTENSELQKKQLLIIEKMKASFEHQKIKIEQAYMNKIKYYQEHETIIVKEEQIRGQNKLEKEMLKMQGEIDRLTLMINLYKEKLNRRENENRNLLVELKICKDKLLTIEEKYREKIHEMTEELRIKIEKWTISEQNFLSRIQVLEITNSEQLTLIEQLRATISARDLRIQELLAEIERLKLTIRQLESRKVEKEIQYVDRVKEVPVIEYRDRVVEADSESDGQVSVDDNETKTQTYEVVSRVGVSRTEAVLPKETIITQGSTTGLLRTGIKTETTEFLREKK